MCKCTPNLRTPFCGKPGCEWPKQETADRVRAETETKDLLLGAADEAIREVEDLARLIARHLPVGNRPSLSHALGHLDGVRAVLRVEMDSRIRRIEVAAEHPDSTIEVA